MSKQLYEEALADVKKLKEVAEDNAKRALLEAVTPRIKELIENQLLGEVEKDEDDQLLLDDLPEELPMSPSSDLSGFDAKSSPADEEKITLDLDVLQPKSSNEELDLSALKASGKEDVYELSVESARALGLLVKESNSQFDKKIESFARQVENLSNASRIIKETAGYSEIVSDLISEAEELYVYVQEQMDSSENKFSHESILENCYSTLKQLMEQKKMKKSLKSLTEAEVTLKLTGLPDDVDLDSVGVDLVAGEMGEEEGEEDLDLETEEGEEEGEEEGDEDLDLGDEEEAEEEDQMESRHLGDDLVVEIDENMLRQEIARMKSLRETKDDVQAWGHGAGEVSDEFADEEMDVHSVKMTTEGELDEDDVLEIVDDEKDEKDVAQEMHEYGNMKEDSLEEMDPKEKMELDELEQAEDTEEHGGPSDTAQSQKQKRSPTAESILKQLDQEAKIQLEAKHKAQKAKHAGKKAQAEQQQAKKKGHQKAAAAKSHQAKKMKEAYVHYAKQFNESVLRTQKLKGMLNEATHKGNAPNGAPARSAEEASVLRDKLAETNLFNTKLLFANKVLQNESFTRAQKAGIIERLDEARSEREVKLVYESLVKTLDNTTRRQVNESRERAVIGSSSRSTRPSSTLNEGFETDRWARLAGINK